MKIVLKTVYLSVILTVFSFFIIYNFFSLPTQLNFTKSTEESYRDRALKNMGLSIAALDTQNTYSTLTFNTGLKLSYPNDMPTKTWLGILLSLHKKTTIDTLEYINLKATYPYATTKNN